MVGILSPYLMGPAQGLLAPSAPAAAMAAPMAQQTASTGGGLLARIAPQMAQSRGYQMFDQRRNMIANALLGGVGAETPLERMRGMAQGALQGRQMDSAYEVETRKQQENRKSIEAAIAALSREGRDDLANAVGNGLPVQEAWNLYFKHKMSGGNDGPASVQEWNHFNQLSPDDQARYLRMKRANPYLDVGTGFVQPDPVNPGQVSGTPIVKENFQKAYDTAVGSETGKAAVEASGAIPGARASAAKIRAQVDALKNDPYLPRMVGPIDSRLPNLSEDAARVQSMIDQLSGGAFLEGRQMLKGGGAITDFESTKAEQALVRMNTAQSEADFKAALEDFAQAVEQGVAKLEAAARNNPAGQQAPQQRLRFNPVTGDFE